MTNGEVRDLVLLLAIVGLSALFVWRSRAWHPAPLPPAVAPQQRPVEDEVSDIRHRVRGFEQLVPVINDHSVRLRTMEREVGEVKGQLQALLQGQQQIGRHVDMLVQHHVEGNQEGRRG